MGVRKWERLAAGLSLLAGAIHVVAGPGHVQEWWVYGLFFFGAAALQGIYGLVLATHGIEGWGGWLAVRRKVYGFGLASTGAIIALWVVSRTLGVPVGPEAFQPEGIGALDASSKAVELALVLILWRLLWVTQPVKPAASPR